MMVLMPTSQLTSDEAWRAIYSLGHETGEKIATIILAELIGMGFILNGNNGPELTSKGWAAHAIAESGKDERVEQLDELPPKT